MNEKTEVCPGAVKEDAAPPPGPGDRVQVDIVRHSAVGAVVQVKLHQVALADANEFAGDDPAESPESVFHAVGEAPAHLAGFQMDDDLCGVIARDGRRHIGGDGQHRLFAADNRGGGGGVFAGARPRGRSGGEGANQNHFEQLVHCGLLSFMRSRLSRRGGKNYSGLSGRAG